MRSVLTALLAVSVVLATLPDLYTPLTPVLGEQVRLVRSPIEVHSTQPVLVFAYAPGGRVVELEVTVYVEARVNVSLPTPPPSPMESTYRVQMAPVPWASGWYVTQIPGLPSRTWTFTYMLRRVGFTVTSKVVYKLVVEGSAVVFDSYIVKELEIAQHLPPLTYAFVYDALEDPGVLNETLGLAPRGWVLGEGKALRIVVVAFDESSEPDVGFEYLVGEGPWTAVTTSDSSLVADLKAFVEAVSNYIRSLESWIRSYRPDVEVPKPRLAIRVSEAIIPPQTAGTYVMFRATARDADGNSATSPMGLYYVVKEVSDTRVLVVDPHVRLWVV